MEHIVFLDTKDCDDCLNPCGQIACFTSGDYFSIFLPEDQCNFQTHNLCYRCSLNHPTFKLQTFITTSDRT